MEIPFDLKFSYDPNLREIPNKPDQFNEAIDFLKTELEANNGSIELAKIHSKLGSLLRIRGQLNESLNHHLEAQELLGGLDEPRLLMINKIRLASTYQFIGTHAKAIDLLEACIREIEKTEDLADLLDFVHQHLGKVYLESGKPSLAKTHFESALDLRLTKNDHDLISSTRIALNLLSTKL